MKSERLRGWGNLILIGAAVFLLGLAGFLGIAIGFRLYPTEYPLILLFFILLPTFTVIAGALVATGTALMLLSRPRRRFV